MEKLLTLAEAAARCGLKPVTLRAYAEGHITPTLPATKIGRAWVVTEGDLLRWINLRKKVKNG